MKKHQSIWIATSSHPAYASFDGEADADVAIVGAGITGLTAALLLARAGRNVCIIEKGEIASQESGLTTAHLTEAIDARYPTLERDFGGEGAKLAARASRRAIEQIESFIAELQVDCGFRYLPGFLYSERENDLQTLREEADAARRAGVNCSFTEDVPLPFRVLGAVRYEHQAQFHPRRYFIALAEEIVRLGGRIFDRTTALDFEDGDPCIVKTARGTIRAGSVIVAANVPVSNRFFIHTKIAAYRSYATATEVPSDFLADALYWDTYDPYHYTRLQEIDGKSYLIIGGEDHKTGHAEDTERSYASLERYVRDRFSLDRIDYRWSGQIIEPVDGLPYIGRNSFSSNLYVSTGYAGQGMTFGTIGGMITADLILGRENEFAKLFEATRVKPIASAKDYLLENVDFPKEFLEQHLLDRDVEGRSFTEIAAGEGKIVEVGGKKVAAHRDREGDLHLLSPICPHLQCNVAWNSAEKSWDCPCHGSRFTPTGQLLNGPATTNLRTAVVKAK